MREFALSCFASNMLMRHKRKESSHSWGNPPIIYLNWTAAINKMNRRLLDVKFFVLAPINPNFHFTPNLNLNVVAQSCRHNVSVVMLKC